MTRHLTLLMSFANVLANWLFFFKTVFFNRFLLFSKRRRTSDSLSYNTALYRANCILLLRPYEIATLFIDLYNFGMFFGSSSCSRLCTIWISLSLSPLFFSFFSWLRVVIFPLYSVLCSSLGVIKSGIDCLLSDNLTDDPPRALLPDIYELSSPPSCRRMRPKYSSVRVGQMEERLFGVLTSSASNTTLPLAGLRMSRHHTRDCESLVLFISVKEGNPLILPYTAQ